MSFPRISRLFGGTQDQDQCGWCHDPDPEMQAAIEAFLRAYPEAEHGPAHIVLADHNVEPHHVRWCIGLTVGTLRRRGVCVSHADHPDVLQGIHDASHGHLPPLLGLWEHMHDDVSSEELMMTQLFLQHRLLPMAYRLETPWWRRMLHRVSHWTGTNGARLVSVSAGWAEVVIECDACGSRRRLA